MDKDADGLFEEAVRAIRDEEEFARGRKLLVEVLRLNPNHEYAWLWLARVVSDRGKQMECVKRALAINPSNSQANMLLERLENGESVAIGSAKPSPAGAPSEALESPSRNRTDKKTLGKLLLSDQMSVRSQAWNILLMVVFLLIAIFAFAIIVGPDNSGPGFIPLVMACIVLPAVIALFFLYQAITGSKKQVEIFEGGIAQISGQTRKTWRWEEFSGLRLNQRSITTHYRLYGVVPVGSSNRSEFQAVFYDLNKKTALKLGKSYPKHGEMGLTLVRAASPTFLQRDLNAYQRGGTLVYGDIQINREGIQRQSFLSKSALRWEEIRSYQVENVVLWIKKSNGKSASYPLNDRLNGFLIPQVLAQIKPAGR